MLQGSELMELGASPLVEQPKQECGIFHKKNIPHTHSMHMENSVTYWLDPQSSRRKPSDYHLLEHTPRVRKLFYAPVGDCYPSWRHVWLRKKLFCLSKCRILSNMTFWPQMSQYQGLLKKMAYFSVKCHFVYMS